VRTGNRLRRPLPAGVSLVEAMLSLVIVAVMLTAALTTVGGGRLSQYKTCLSTRGMALAEGLMAEILQQPYQDPNAPILFGPEAGESTATRRDFDDVDDYNGWTSSPPVQKDGSPVPGTTGWRQTVTVQWVDPADPTSVASVESHVKRITVRVLFGDMEVAVLTALKTSADAP